MLNTGRRLITLKLGGTHKKKKPQVRIKYQADVGVAGQRLRGCLISVAFDPLMGKGWIPEPGHMKLMSLCLPTYLSRRSMDHISGHFFQL